MAEEGLTATRNQCIFIAKPKELNASVFYPALDSLIASAYKEDDEAIKQEVSKIVNTYKVTSY